MFEKDYLMRLIKTLMDAINRIVNSINKEDIEVVTDEIPGFEIASKGSLTVALDINISDNLKIFELPCVLKVSEIA